MAATILDDLMKVFFRTGTSVVAVVSEDKTLIGLVHKEKLVRELSDLRADNPDLKQIPTGIIDLPVQSDFLPALEKTESIPVVGLAAAHVADWGRVEIMQALEKAPMPNIKSFAPKKVDKPNTSLEWFKEMILESIQNPLFVTDLDGKTLFYNKPFKEQILTHRKIQNPKKCEQFFLAKNREIVAASLESGRDINTPQYAPEPLAGFDYMMVPLIGERFRGYLYEFMPALTTEKSAPAAAGNPQDSQPLEEQVFDRESNNRLNELLAEYEQRIIDLTLKKFNRNISRTAEFLGIPRQTLQFRIRKLLKERDTTTPRKRKTVLEEPPAVTDSVAKNKKSAAKQTAKSPAKKPAKNAASSPKKSKAKTKPKSAAQTKKKKSAGKKKPAAKGKKKR